MFPKTGWGHVSFMKTSPSWASDLTAERPVLDWAAASFTKSFCKTSSEWRLQLSAAVIELDADIHCVGDECDIELSPRRVSLTQHRFESVHSP